MYLIVAVVIVIAPMIDELLMLGGKLLILGSLCWREGGANFGGRDFAWLPPLPSCYHQCPSAQFVACIVYNALAASIS